MHIHPVAVSDEAGTTTLIQTSASWGNSLLQPTREALALYGPDLAPQEEARVEVSTLDALLHDVGAIDLLKLDVQGLELQVMAGAQDVLSRTSLVMVEMNFYEQYEGGSTFAGTHKTLNALGFSLASMEPATKVAGRALWTDALYARW